ncbi:class I SAM-dependent methyltransferase [Nakamurella deserti]|uniref:class I SAM-dependent methyltransferase n=1 Tax=Nakamurella deserti TaxID=2164074 RepID=UPI000DBE5F7D|nr:class I SAM-dependent methyltransferase [Nakamurella deserti]
MTTQQNPPTRWQTETVGERWTGYRERFAELVASGADLDGEARLLDAMLPRGAAVLDAGCGTGRVTDALRRRGHRAVGVDRDEGLLAAARAWYPGSSYVAADLLTLTPDLLAAAGAPTAFDLVALPGNVLVYLAPGTERQVLAVLRGLLRPAGRIVAGFATDRDYRVDALDVDAAALGLTVEHRFATWDLVPWTADADWCVTVLRAD